MAQTRMLSQVPEYGWTRRSLLADIELGGVTAVSDPVERPPGTSLVGVSATVPAASLGGAGTFGFLLEGSNTGGDTISMTLRNLAGVFVVGETVTGGSSGATGVITRVGLPSTIPGIELTIQVDTWNEVDFLVEESILGSLSGATADVANVLSEWTELARTNVNELFDASAGAQGRVLGLSAGLTPAAGTIGSGMVPCGRWTFLRVRSFVETGAPLFTMDIRLTTIAGNGEARREVLTLRRFNGDVVEPVSPVLLRPEGTRFVSAQMFMETLLNVPTPPATGADGFNFELQGALDQNAVDAGEWETLDRLGSFQVEGETRFMANGQVTLMDMGSFNFFRVVGFKVSRGTEPSDNLSRYVARALFNFDDNDWLDGARGIAHMPEMLQEMFVQCHFGEPVLVGGNVWAVKVQLCNLNLIPLRNTRPIGLLVSDSAFGAQFDLSVAGTIPAAPKGNLFFGAGTNLVTLQTESDGEGVITVDTGGGTVFLQAYNWIPNIPEFNDSDFGPGQFVISTERLQLPPPP